MRGFSRSAHLRVTTAIAFALLTGARARAQLQTAWQHTLPPTFAADPRAVLTPTGDVVVASTSDALGAQALRIALDGFDANGTQTLALAFTPNGDSTRAADLTVDTASGDLLVLGSTRSVATGANDELSLSRFDASGNLVWTTRYSTPDDDLGRRVRVGTNGEIYVLGVGVCSCFPIPVVNSPYLLVFSPAGVLQSSTSLPGDTDIVDLGRHPAGGAVVTTLDTHAPQSTLHVLLVDSSASILWSRAKAQGSGWVPRRNVTIDRQGRVFAGGSVAITPAHSNASIHAFDANGVDLWTATFDDPARDLAGCTSLALDGTGNVVATAVVDDASFSDGRGVVFSCDATGAARWSRTIGTSPGGRAYLSTLAVDRAGNSIAAGRSGVDGVLLRHDRDGRPRGVFLVPPAANDTLLVLDVLASGAGDFTYLAVEFTPTGTAQGTIIGRVHEQGVPFCFGDGSATPCPCGNASAFFEQAGCRNSTGSAAQLVDEGVASLSSDSLVLRTHHTTASGTTFFVQGDLHLNGGAGAVFGDGLTCLGGALVRLRNVPASGGSASIGAGSTAPISALGLVLAPGLRTYQALYRNAASFCTPSTFNTSNGLELTWTL